MRKMIRFKNREYEVREGLYSRYYDLGNDGAVFFEVEEWEGGKKYKIYDFFWEQLEGNEATLFVAIQPLMEEDLLYLLEWGLENYEFDARSSLGDIVTFSWISSENWNPENVIHLEIHVEDTNRISFDEESLIISALRDYGLIV